MNVLDSFSPSTRAWFAASFAAPTAAQIGAWEAIGRGESCLVVAPTGSGKTLAAFLAALDRLAHAAPPSGRSPGDPEPRRCRIVYLSPLKALAVDVERNLRAPLAGIRRHAAELGQPVPDVTVWVRSGDTPADQRRAFARRPADILITTPESLYLLLTSRAREALRSVDTVIVDEVHAVAGTKRGAHLTLSLERLDALLAHPAQRIGLSATVRPVEAVARFLGGAGRSVTVVQPPATKTVELEVIVPVEDMSELDAGPRTTDPGALGPPVAPSIWPHVDERIAALVEAHRSTIVFANSRRIAERLTARLNELAGTEIARAHHGSVSREQRAVTEEALKAGRLPAVVATSSLELGIDMGAVDLVVQVEAPPSVASGLQRVGRSGHQVGAVSHGVLFPKYRGDLLCCAVVAERMRAGDIEALRGPRNPLDVLAQQIVAMVAVEEWQVEALAALIRRAAPFAELPDAVLDAVLDMLAGRYPSDEFAELRPRLVWDRVTGVLHSRPGAQRLAVTSGGTIPDRGLFGVFLVGEGSSRVGELDEEMVYESRVGDVFTLGSSAWRIEEITHDRVLVSPAPGQPGRVPFWKGDALGRPLELGRALGAFVREISQPGAKASRTAEGRLRAAGLDTSAARNLLAYLAEQRDATGTVPDDRTVLVERFRDELGDWRIVIHSPFGAQVHAPWALVLGARLREEYGIDVQATHADDGIVLRLPETDEPPSMAGAFLDPQDVEALVTAALGGSALFAARFRECAARALLLPRRDPGRRAPLWQQRQRSAQLLSIASRYRSFPIVLETMRECLQDVFDVPGLVALMRDVAARTVRVVEVETPSPSPFARSLLFGYVAAFLYEGDTPLAERRAAALALDPTLLAELLGSAALRELLEESILDEVHAELQRLTPERAVRDAEGLADALRLLGDLSTSEALARGAEPGWLADLEAARRAIRVRIAGEERWVAIEDAGRLRDALGVPLPVGVPEAFLERVADPVADLIARYARTHGPFSVDEPARRFGVGPAVVRASLRGLGATGRVVEGEFRPGGSGLEWCDTTVLRRLRHRTLARLRAQVEPVPTAVLGRFLPAWQGVGGAAVRGVDGLARVIEQLAGVPVPASTLESLVLPIRVADYTPGMLDELTTSGEVVWAGAGALPGTDGWVVLAPAEHAALLLAPPGPDTDLDPLEQAVLAALDGDAALFFRALADRLASGTPQPSDSSLASALWRLVWAGRITNDSLAPLRVRLGSRALPPRSRSPRRVRALRPALPSRTGPPGTSGRWSAVPTRDPDPTRRAHALADALIDRHGVLTRGAVIAERVAGGFAGVYPVLRAFEEAGRCRRGYFIESLGAAQFASPGAVDRLRALARDRPEEPLWETPVPRGWVGDRRGPSASGPGALVLAATDPANPYGGALHWPDDGDGGHRPARKAGALVVLVDGALALYVERGGRTLLSFTPSPAALRAAADALALAVRDGQLGRLAVERADGAPVLASPLGAALEEAGFRPTPRGLRLRG